MKSVRFLAIALVTMMVVPSGVSAHCEGKHIGGHPHCSDPGSEDPHLTIARWWSQSTSIYEMTTRECMLESGHYTCDDPDDQYVYFNLVGGQEIDRKGNPIPDTDPLCSAAFSMVPTHYPYSWEGDCMSTGGCEVRIRNWFAGDQHPDSGVGLVILDGYTEIKSSSDPNPFLVPRLMMQMHTVIVTYKAKGKNRNLAVCRWSETDTDMNLNLGDVTFDSVPKPPP